MDLCSSSTSEDGDKPLVVKMVSQGTGATENPNVTLIYGGQSETPAGTTSGEDRRHAGPHAALAMGLHSDAMGEAGRTVPSPDRFRCYMKTESVPGFFLFVRYLPAEYRSGIRWSGKHRCQHAWRRSGGPDRALIKYGNLSPKSPAHRLRSLMRVHRFRPAAPSGEPRRLIH